MADMRAPRALPRGRRAPGLCKASRFQGTSSRWCKSRAASRRAMRPADKARRARIPPVFDRGATPSPGMQRSSNAAGLAPRAARACGVPRLGDLGSGMRSPESVGGWTCATPADHPTGRLTRLRSSTPSFSSARRSASTPRLSSGHRCRLLPQPVSRGSTQSTNAGRCHRLRRSSNRLDSNRALIHDIVALVGHVPSSWPRLLHAPCRK